MWFHQTMGPARRDLQLTLVDTVKEKKRLHEVCKE